MHDDKAWTWRLEHIPKGTTREQLKLFFVEADQSRIEVESLVPESIVPDLCYHAVARFYLSATVSFRAREGRRPQLLDEYEGKISLDADFYGFTSLYAPENEPIAADVVAVTGLAGHAFGSWMHSRTRSRTQMWLRDYLPEDIPNIRILIYGYPSGLQNSVSTISLFEHSNNLKERLLAMRHAAQCQKRPIIFIGHSLGGLIVKRVVVDTNRTEETLPVRSFVFLGAPHRGLEITALKTLVQGTSSESMISELKEGSSVLEMLDHDFEKHFRESTLRGSALRILTCYESYPTPTVRKSSDGSWKRDGDRIMMVTKAHAHLGYEDNEIGVYSDHSKIAKIDISTTGPFLSIKQAIDRALLGRSEKLESPEPSALHPSNDIHIQRSRSAVALLEKDERPTAGLTPEIAEKNSLPAPTVALGRTRSQGAIQGSTGLVTVVAARSSRRDPVCLGEDIPINRAILDGNIAEVRKLSNGALLDKLDSQGYTPLMVAAAMDVPQIVEDLIARGTSLKISGPHCDTAFHIACKHAGTALVSMFLKYPELLDTRGAEGRTPLMSSIQNSKADVPKLLLDSTSNVETFDEDGKTALHHAAIMGKTELVRLLVLDRGANKDRTTKSGWTPIHCAAHSWHPKIIDFLGMNGADCKALTSEQDGARSGIHLILLSPGRTRCITLLVRYGADIEQPDGAGNTPLHWAAQHGTADSVDWLVSKKADIEARTRYGGNRTPLHIAVQVRRYEIARILLNAGANIEAAMKDPSGKAALHITTEGSTIDMVKVQSAREASVDPSGLFTNTPLMIATKSENLRIMRLLLRAGADVEGKRSTAEFRPLFTAVRKGNFAAVLTLLDYNAAPDIKGTTTPLAEASEAGNIAIMKELLAEDVRADVERTNDNGYPCLFIAASFGHVDAVKLLLDHGADPDREVVVKKLQSSNNIRRAGEMFESSVSMEDRRTICKILSRFQRGRNGR